MTNTFKNCSFEKGYHTRVSVTTTHKLCSVCADYLRCICRFTIPFAMLPLASRDVIKASKAFFFSIQVRSIYIYILFLNPKTRECFLIEQGTTRRDMIQKIALVRVALTTKDKRKLKEKKRRKLKQNILDESAPHHIQTENAYKKTVGVQTDNTPNHKIKRQKNLYISLKSIPTDHAPAHQSPIQHPRLPPQPSQQTASLFPLLHHPP